MQFHTLIPKTKQRKEKRIGRGGKRGTYSGRGVKGQRARAGAKIRPQERELVKKIPKLRGYKFKSFRSSPSVVNLKDVGKVFTRGEEVNPHTLLEKGLVSKIKGRMPRVKILGEGTLNIPLIFKNVEFSQTTRKKIGSMTQETV